MAELHFMNQEQLDEELIDVCYKQQWDKALDLLQSPGLKLHARPNAGGGYAFNMVCANGPLSLVKQMLSASQANQEWDSKIEQEALVVACSKGRLEVVQYLLSGEDVKRKAQVEGVRNSPFLSACRQGSLEVVRYLLFSPQLKKHVRLYPITQQVLKEVCGCGHVDLLRYFLTSTELTQKGIKHLDIHVNDDVAFHFACQTGQTEILKYLIVEFNIKKTPSIQAMIGQYPQADKMFLYRDMQDKATSLPMGKKTKI